MKNIAILLVALFAIILACGCISAPAPQNTSMSMLTLPTTTPVPTYTFATVTYSTQLVPAQTPTPAPTFTASPIDPVVGEWSAVGVPYTCNVFFAQDNSGSLVCGEIGIPIGSRVFSWSNTGTDGLGNATYQILIQNPDQSVPPTEIDTAMNGTGYMTASNLPSNGYLVKVLG